MAIELEKLSVLVVDDNPHMRILVREILHGLNVRDILACSDGSAALAEMKHFPADLAVVDWMMEPMDGLEFTRQVRTASDSPNPYLPIIMLTGHTERFRVMQARDAGINEFLAKPVMPLGMYSRIRAVIEHPRPFVKVGEYLGPDRRRKVEDMIDGGRREEDPPANDETADKRSRSSRNATDGDSGEEAKPATG